MASYNRYIVSSGSVLTKYNITFPFLEKADVKVNSVLTNGEVLNWTRLEESTFNASFVNNQSNLSFGNYCVINENGINKIQFIPATQAGNYQLIIYRRTNEKLLSNFSNGSPIQAEDLNKIVLLTKYATEEALDQPAVLFANLPLIYSKYDKTGGEIVGNISATGTISSASSITAQSFNLNGGTLTNVPTPTNASDGANKAYVDSVGGGGGGGGGGGAVTITDDSITSAFLRKVGGQEAVITTAIRDSAVTSAKLSTDAVTTAKILNNAVNSDKLATDAVTTTKILDGAVTPEKLANNAFLGSSVVNNTLDFAKLKNPPFSYNDTIINHANDNNSTLTINSKISSTKSATFSDLVVSSVAEYTQLNSSESVYFRSPNSAEQQFLIKKNALSSVSLSQANPSPFSSSDLSLYSGQPLVLETLGTSTRKAGYLDYNIVVKPKAFSNVNSCILRLKRPPLPANNPAQRIYGYADLTGSQWGAITKNTISNILFNWIEGNEDMNITLNTTTGALTFVASSQPIKYLLRLSGSVFSSIGSGSLVIRPITNTFGGQGADNVIGAVDWNQGTGVRAINLESCFTLGYSNITRAYQYYYTNDTGVTPTNAQIRWHSTSLGLPSSKNPWENPIEAFGASQHPTAEDCALTLSIIQIV